MAHSSRARSIITPILDVMQTLPSFTYLLPLMLLFGIGAPAAVVCTLIYSLPPVMRISAHGLQNLSATALEATDSMGQTPWQRLSKVELPMAKRTIIVGINQTTMAALSMATIAAFINGPGLGQPVVARPERAARRRRLRARHLHRADGDHARPGHHRGERARREARPRAVARDGRPAQPVPRWRRRGA